MKKIALVTGASRGIGKAAALALARDGWTVHVNYIQSQAAAEAVAAQTGGLAHPRRRERCAGRRRHVRADGTGRSAGE